MDSVVHPALRSEILAKATVRQRSACEREFPEFCVVFEGVSEKRLQNSAVVGRIGLLISFQSESCGPLAGSLNIAVLKTLPFQVVSRIRPRLTEITCILTILAKRICQIALASPSYAAPAGPTMTRWFHSVEPIKFLGSVLRVEQLGKLTGLQLGHRPSPCGIRLFPP